MSYIISKSGYEEIESDPMAAAMDLNISNRGKAAGDCGYVIESNPERFKVTERGLEEKSLPELVEAGLESLDALKAQKKAEIKAAYLAQRATVNKGILSATLGKEIDCRESDITDMTIIFNSLVRSGASGLPDGYKCKDDSYVPCTTVQLGKVLDEMTAEIWAMWGHLQELTSAIDACKKAADVEKIVWVF